MYKTLFEMKSSNYELFIDDNRIRDMTESFVGRMGKNLIIRVL